MAAADRGPDGVTAS